MAISNQANELTGLASGTVGAKSDPSVSQTNYNNVDAKASTNYTPNSVQQPSFNNGFQQAQPDQPQNFGASWSGHVGKGIFAGLNGYDVPYNVANGRVNAFLAAFQEAAKQEVGLRQNEQQWDFFTFDGQANQTVSSAVLFVRDEVVNQRPISVVYAFLIQDPNEALPDKAHNTWVNGQQASISLPQLTEELLTSDSYTMERIVEFVSTRKGNRQVFFAGGRLLPTFLEPSNVHQIGRCLFYMNAAAQTKLNELAGFRDDFTLASKLDDENFRIKVDFRPGLAVDAVGSVRRNDVAIRMKVRKHANQGNNNRNNMALGQIQEKSFSNVSGFYKFLYNPAPAQPIQTPYGLQMPQFTPIYQPCFVITSLDNQFDIATLSTQLAALSSAAVAATSNIMTEALRPNYQITEEGADPNDIGNLTVINNYPGEPEGYTNTKDANFQPHLYIQKYFHNSVKIFLDVEEAGDLAYIQRAFIEEAGVGVTNEHRQRAQQKLFEAAQHLTAGYFAEEWAPFQGQQFFSYEVGRVELGHWYDAQQQIHDIREIDAIRCVASNVRPEVVNDFIDSYNHNQYPDEMQRFGIRKSVYDTYFQGYELTGFARRLTVNPNFVAALDKAIRRAAPGITIDSQFIGNQPIERGYVNQVPGVLLNSITAFTPGGYYGPNGQQGGGRLWRNYQAYPTYIPGSNMPGYSYGQ